VVHLLIDHREKKPELRKVIADYPRHIEWTTLQAGDYACSDACCGWERKEADFDNMRMVLIQTNELRQAYPNHYLVVTRDNEWASEKGSRMYAPRIALLGSLASRGLPVQWCPSYHYMLDLMYQTFTKNHDTKKRGEGEFSSVRHVKKKDVVIDILTSIPGIGEKKAKDIINQFGSVANFVTADTKDIMKISGIGINTCDRIIDALYSEVD